MVMKQESMSTCNITKNSIPLVVWSRVEEDKVVHHREQRCFYSRDLDMDNLQVPPTVQQDKKYK